MREAQGARWKEPQGGLLKQGGDEVSHRKNLKVGNLMTTPSKDPIRWFTLEDIEKLRDDDEIFVETKEILQTLLPMGVFR